MDYEFHPSLRLIAAEQEQSICRTGLGSFRRLFFRRSEIDERTVCRRDNGYPETQLSTEPHCTTVLLVYLLLTTPLLFTFDL